MQQLADRGLQVLGQALDCLRLLFGNLRIALTVAQTGYKAGHPRIGNAHEALEHSRQAKTIYQQATAVDPAWITAVDALSERIAGATLPTQKRAGLHATLDCTP